VRTETSALYGVDTERTERIVRVRTSICPQHNIEARSALNADGKNHASMTMAAKKLGAG
jgi:hypothetical protein